MDEGKYERKCWGGVVAHTIGRCRYCKEWSFAEVMLVDEFNRPYHKQCKENREREKADSTMNLSEVEK